MAIDISEWMPEFKVSAESDSDLMAYFIKTPSLQKLISGDKWMVIGRKGTGKTAIYEYLRQAKRSEIDNAVTIPLGFGEYPWPIHKLYRESMESETSAYQRSWRYIIIIKCISNLIKQHEETATPLGELDNAKTTLSRLFGSPDPTLLEIIRSKIFRFKSVVLPSLETDGITATAGSIELEDVAQNEELQRKLRSNAFSLLSHLEGIFKKFVGTFKQIVVIDQLDESWLAGQMEEYSRILVNLILCVQTFNSTYKGKSKVVIFLRTDIYTALQFNDKNKIFQDCAVEIKWDHDSIDKLVLERIQKFAPKSLGLNFKEMTSSIFENKTVRHSATPLKHILRRSFYRPRDILVYLNKIKEAHTPTKKGLYTSKDLYSADALASQSLYSELLDEWASQKPDFETYLQSIQSIGYEIFTTKQFHEKYRTNNTAITEAQSQEVLRFLFINSIVGQKSSLNWEYICTNPHIQIDFSRPFHVNNGLKYRLVLTENRSKRKKKAPVQAKGVKKAPPTAKKKTSAKANPTQKRIKK